MTDLVERYLAAVERRLAKDGAEDIIAELREAIDARIEAKAGEMGRDASADDIARVLKDFGHPAIVASRYSGREYLIGPQLYPWFWDAQRTGVGLVIAISLIVLCLRALASDAPVEFALRSFDEVIEGAIFAFGLITVVFVLMERTKADLKLASSWNPKGLPRDNVRKPKSMFETVFTLAFDIVFILWWTGIVAIPNNLPGQGNSMSLQFAEAWIGVHDVILALAVLGMATHIADLIHPAWSRLRAVVSIAGHAVGLGVLWVLLRAGPLVSLEAAAAESERAQALSTSVNMSVTIGLAVTGVIWAVMIGTEAWRLWQSLRPRASAAGPA